jgi:hypothetical protein
MFVLNFLSIFQLGEISCQVLTAGGSIVLSCVLQLLFCEKSQNWLSTQQKNKHRYVILRILEMLDMLD